MPTSFTVKKIPDALYARLKESADMNHRSVNGEAIACLEKALVPTRLTAEVRLARIASLRSGIQTGAISEEDIAVEIKKKRS